MNGENMRLLVVEDDVKLLRAVELYLTQAGYEVKTATRGQTGLQGVLEHRPDLIVLDLMLPDVDGLEVCRRVREVSSVPIVILTARGAEEERITGLRTGADDYVVKPFSLKELEARIEAVLRRAALPPTVKAAAAYEDEYLLLDPTERRVVVEGKLVELTPTEYQLLVLLVENAGRVMTHDQLLQRVWGWEYTDSVDHLRVYMWRLRQKIEKEPSRPQYLLTEHGVGYRFEKAGERWHVLPGGRA